MEKKILFLETNQERQSLSIIQENPSLSLTKEQESQIITRNQEDNSAPKICAIFSLNNEPKMKEEEEVAQMSGGIFEEVAEGEDEESIEEFDPEDPAFQEDEEEEEFSRSPAAVYKYDMLAKSYVRVEGDEDIVSMKSGISQTSEGEGENQKEGIRQPNILKRRLLMSTTATKSWENDEIQNEVESIPKECKVQKLDLNNPLSVNNTSHEDGIMYVTVKGSKPNEILLVKVSEYVR